MCVVPVGSAVGLKRSHSERQWSLASKNLALLCSRATQDENIYIAAPHQKIGTQTVRVPQTLYAHAFKTVGTQGVIEFREKT